MLKVHLKGGDIHSYGEGEAAFARLIASRELFYKKTGDRFTPLNVSTITTYLRNVKSKVLTEIAEERAEEKKWKREAKKNKHLTKEILKKS